LLSLPYLYIKRITFASIIWATARQHSTEEAPGERS
jgi:hypothetical protein